MRLDAILKVMGILGSILFSSIGIFFTHATYTREARVAEAAAIVQMSETLVGMQINCMKNWQGLNRLTWNKTLRPQREQEVKKLIDLIYQRQLSLNKTKDTRLRKNLEEEVEELEERKKQLQRAMNEQERKERCYESYRRSREMVLSASTVIQKPWCTNDKKWKDAWKKLKMSLEDTGTQGYKQNVVGKLWKQILDLKGIYAVDPTYTSRAENTY